MKHLKKTDAECKFFARIECLVVSRNSRRSGYARALLKDSIERIKQNWPLIRRVELDVYVANENARKLYESEGFVLSAIQSESLAMMEVVQYEKQL